MDFSERCVHATQLLHRLKTVVDNLDNDACELEVSHEDEPVLVRLVQSFIECNRLSEEILYELIPHIDQAEYAVGSAVGSAIRLAHDELMRRARGAHTDMEIYTKIRRKPWATHPPHRLTA